MSDLILVNPPQPGLLNGFANGLIDLGNFVQARVPDALVQIVDLSPYSSTMVQSKLQESIAPLRSDRVFVGITTTTASYQSALGVARSVKEIHPEAIVILGGHHASPQHEVILRHHSQIVDIVVRGEGERSLASLMRGEALEAVPGISFLKAGLPHTTPQAPLLCADELDSLPTDFRGQAFTAAPGKFGHATYVSARGCPLRCAFCAVAGEPIRAKSIQRVIEDIWYLVSVKGYTRLAIEDNFFAQNKTRTLKLCDSIVQLQNTLSLPFSWDCQTRVESLHDSEVTRALERAGCDAVYLGVEAVTPDELLYLGKTSQPERYLDLLNSKVVPGLLKSQIECFLNLQVGLPSEGPFTRAARLARLAKLGEMAVRKVVSEETQKMRARTLESGRCSAKNSAAPGNVDLVCDDAKNSALAQSRGLMTEVEELKFSATSGKDCRAAVLMLQTP